MALSVAATFASLPEAQIAAGALRASGVDAQVFDDNFGTMMWTDQVAIGGFRVIVPEVERADAVAFLRDVAKSAPRRRPSPRERGVLWRALALLAGLALLPEAGWLVIGLKRRASYPGRAGFAVMFVVSMALFLVVTIAAWALGLSLIHI